jgi:hypothetical protein
VRKDLYICPKFETCTIMHIWHGLDGGIRFRTEDLKKKDKYVFWEKLICRSVGWLNLYWSSPAQAFLVLSFVEICDQDFCSRLNMYVIRNGASSSSRGGVNLCMRYVRCAVVSALTAKLLLVLASTVIFSSEVHGNHDYSLS